MAEEKAFETLQKRLDEMAGGISEIKVTAGNWKEIEKKLNSVEEQFRSLEEKLKPRGMKPDGTPDTFSLPGAEDEIKKGRKFLISQAIRMHTGIAPFSDADLKRSPDLAFTRDIYKEAKKRDMAANVGPSGGFLVPMEVMQSVTELLTADMVLRKAGATFESFSGSPVPYPRETSQQTAAYTGENSTITASDVAYAEVQAEARKLCAMTKVSNEWLKLASPGTAEASINRRLLSALGLKWEEKALRGDNSGRDPLGLLFNGDVTKVAVGANGDTVDYPFLLSLRAVLTAANAWQRAGAKLAIITSPGIESKILAIGTPISFPLDKSVGNNGNVYEQKAMGIPLYTTTQIPVNKTKGSGTTLSEIYIGAWDDLKLPEWGPLTVLASNVAGTAFADDQTWIRGIHMNDAITPRPASFVVASFAVS